MISFHCLWVSIRYRLYFSIHISGTSINGSVLDIDFFCNFMKIPKGMLEISKGRQIHGHLENCWV